MPSELQLLKQATVYQTGSSPAPTDVPLLPGGPLHTHDFSYPALVARRAGVVHVGTLPVAWRELRNGSVLEFAQLELTCVANDTETATAPLRVHLPSAIRPDCSVFQAYSSQIIADLLLSDGSFYTLNVSVDTETGRIGHKITSTEHPELSASLSAGEWSLSAAHSLFPLSNDTFIIPLDSGAFVHLSRPSLAEPFLLTVRAKPPSRSAPSGLRRLLSVWGSQDAAPQEDTSTRLIAATALPANSRAGPITAVLSADGTVRLSLSPDLGNPHCFSLFPELSQEQIALLWEDRPASLLELVETADSPLLVAYIPAEEPFFAVYSLNVDRNSVKPSSQPAVIRCEQPTTAPALLHDFQAVVSSGSSGSVSGVLLEIWALWNSDAVSCVQTCAVPVSPGSETSPAWIRSDFSSEFTRTNISLLAAVARDDTGHTADLFCDRIVYSGLFSPAVVSHALRLFSRSAEPAAHSADLPASAGELKAAAERAVDEMVDAVLETGKVPDDAYDSLILDAWVRLESICIDLLRQGNDGVSLSVAAATGAVWVSKGLSVDVVRQCTLVEVLAENSASAGGRAEPEAPLRALLPRRQDAALLPAALELAGVAREFRQKLLPEVLVALESEMLAQIDDGRITHSVTDRMTRLASLLHRGYAEAALADLVATVTKLGAELPAVLAFIGRAMFDDGSYAAAQTSRKKQPLAPVGRLYLRRTLRELFALGRDVASGMAIATGVLSSRSSTWSLGESYEESLDCFRMFHLASRLARLTVKDELVLAKFLRQEQAVPGSLTRASEVWGITLQYRSELFLVRVVDYLVEEGELSAAAELVPALAGGGKAGVMLQCGIQLLQGQLTEAAGLLESHIVDMFARKLTAEDRELLEASRLLQSYRELLEAPSAAAGYFYLGRLFQERFPLEEVAMGFMKKAVAMSKDGDGPNRAEIYKNILDLAERLGDLDVFYNTMVELTDSLEFEKLLARFLAMVVDSGAGAEQTLFQYPFVGCEPQVDAVLADICRKDTSKYPMLYTWRIHGEDFRGAAAALYLYILSVRDRLKQLQADRSASGREMEEMIYLVSRMFRFTINALLCLERDDAWIVVPVGSKKELLTIKDIYAQENDWLSLVEDIEISQMVSAKRVKLLA